MIKIAFVIGDYPPQERRRREEVARGYSSADVEVGIVSVAARPFDGLGPAEIQAAAPLFHEAFRQAERAGYDAVVGEQFGVVCYHPSAIARHRAQTRAYGMEPFIAGRRASGFYLQHIADNREQMVDSFLKAARALIDDDGADVIIAQGITQCPLEMKPQWLMAEL